MKNQQQTQNRTCPYLARAAFLKDAFTPDECKQIINTGLNDWEEVEGLIQKDEDVEDFDIRNRNTTLFVPPKNSLQDDVKGPDGWIFSKIFSVIMEFNNHGTGYQFHVQGFLEPPSLVRYQAADINKHGKPGHYDWHMDVGPGPHVSMRKISFSLLLNPGEYEGGELCFHIGGGDMNEPFPNQDGIGTVIIFPSYLVHKISPMIKGTRYVIVGWIHGNSFI